MAEGKLVVAFGPRWLERVIASLILIVGLGEIAAGVALATYHPVSTIDCDRTTCHAKFASLLAGTSDVTLDVAGLVDSRIEKIKGGERHWVVDSKGKTIELSPPTGDDAQLADFTKMAKDFQAFLSDASRPKFSASYATLGGPPLWLFAIMGALLLLWSGRWIRGWHAELAFDRAAGTLVIRQRPFARTRTIQLADIANVEASDRVAVLGYGVMRYARIWITGKDRKTLWSHRTLFDGKTYKTVQANFTAMREFLSAR